MFLIFVFFVCSRCGTVAVAYIIIIWLFNRMVIRVTGRHFRVRALMAL